MEIAQKIKLIRTSEGLSQPKLSKLIDIPLNTIGNYETGSRKVSAEYLLKLSDKFSKYALWLMTDQVAPEVGQVSPEDNQPQMNCIGVPEKLLDDAFGQTMTTAIALSWLTPKEGIEFSMLSDLHRHNFVEAGGILFSQDSEQEENESKAG
jgi:transcriptional regulator with XRE-family HTH domain